MKRTQGGLYVATNFNFLRHFGRAKGRQRTVRLPSGEKAKVWIDDSRTVKQTEHGDHLDAVVRPEPIRGIFTLQQARALARVNGVVSPGPVRTGFKVRKAN
jgi:hypothetical protein